MYNKKENKLIIFIIGFQRKSEGSRLSSVHFFLGPFWTMRPAFRQVGNTWRACTQWGRSGPASLRCLKQGLSFILGRPPRPLLPLPPPSPSPPSMSPLPLPPSQHLPYVPGHVFILGHCMDDFISYLGLSSPEVGSAIFWGGALSLECYLFFDVR